MKTQTKRTITLSASEVKEAVREYISLHSVGSIHVPDDFSVFVILDAGARHADVEIEAQLFD